MIHILDFISCTLVKYVLSLAAAVFAVGASMLAQVNSPAADSSFGEQVTDMSLLRGEDSCTDTVH